MTLLTIFLFSFAVTDLTTTVFGREGRNFDTRFSSVAGVAAALLAAWGLGVDTVPAVITTAVLAVFILAWSWACSSGKRSPTTTISVFALTAAVAFIFSGQLESFGGEFGVWYSNLRWTALSSVPPGQVAMGLASFLFLTSSSNRVVSSVLQIAGTPVEKGEQRLKGGRLLGVMERWIVAGMVLAGEPAGAAVVFAAKGLLRFPTVRDSADPDSIENIDEPGWTAAEYSEYFLVGTFSSLLIAAAVAVLIAASG